MAQKITKAVIPAAGLGTRFLPATKAMAKEIIPIVDKPTIQFIVEEVLDSGIEEILIITGRNKRSVEDHFDSNYELEQNLEEKGKIKMLEMVRSTTLENVQFKRQHYPKGLGDAVYHAKSFVGDDPFLLCLGDDVMASDVPASKQLIDASDNYDEPMVLVQEVVPEMVHYYGIIDEGEKVGDGVYKVNDLIEKPKNSKSRMAICGRYILTPDVFDAIDEAGVNEKSGEVELTDALSILSQDETVLSCHYEGDWYEVGEPLGLVKASIQYALQHPDIGEGFHDYLKNEVIPQLKEDKA